MGSPPHTRDKLLSYDPVWILPRIIPAYAGQIPLLIDTTHPIRDHPRIRGTNFFEDMKDTDVLRIIPAYAGQIIH